MEDFRDRIKKVPDYVRAQMRESSVINKAIADKFVLSDNEIDRVIKITVAILLQELSINDFFSEIKKNFPHFEENKLKELALKICYKRFYPLRDYIRGIENIILNLGGKIPQNEPLFSEIYSKEVELEEKKEKEESEGPKAKEDEQITSQSVNKIDKDIRNLNIKEAIEAYPQILKQFISAKPLRLKEFDYLVNPTVKNWLKDYIDNLGVVSHNNYERVNYLFNSGNGRKLDPIDRNIINNLLKSYDEGLKLPIDIELKQIIISKLVGDTNVYPEEVEPEVKGNTINLKNKK